MKQYSQDLFLLIKSMGKAEKGYFRKFASLHVKGDKNLYLTLFDEMNKQVDYGEPAQVSVLRKKLSSGRIAYLKHYLYLLILKSLNQFHAPHYTSLHIRELVLSAEILYSKSLYGQVSRLVRKAKNLAGAHEKLPPLLDIIQWEDRLHLRGGDMAAWKEFIEKSHEEETGIIRKLSNISLHRKNLLKLLLFERKYGPARDKSAWQKYMAGLRRTLPYLNRNVLSLRSRILLLQFYSILYRVKGDEKKSFHYRRELIGLFDSDPYLVETEFEMYVSSLNNLLLSYSHLKQDKLFFNALAHMRSLPSRYPRLCQSTVVLSGIFMFSYGLELDFYIESGRFGNGMQIIPVIEAGLKKYAGKINRVAEIDIYYLMAYAYFGGGRYDLALAALNRILNDPEARLRENAYAFARILHLVAHYEMGHEDILEYEIKSTYRFLLSKQRMYRTEQTLLDFMRRNLFSPLSRGDLLQSFRKLKDVLGRIAVDPYEQKALIYFDVIAWLESKISHRPFADIVREQAMTMANIKSGK